MTTLTEFAQSLSPKVKGTLQGSAKITVKDEGSIMLNDQGADVGEGDADVTLTATRKVLQAIIDGSQNPIMAVMSGKLKVDGSQMRALKVSEILTS